MSRARAPTCARAPRDGRVAAAPAREASAAHSGRREATASATNRLRIVAAAKAASPPASLRHHPTRVARHPRPRTPPPRSNRRIHRYPSPLHPSSNDRWRVRATGSPPVAPPCPRLFACPPASSCTWPGTGVFCWKATTTGCLGDRSTDGPSDFRWTRRGPHTGPSTSVSAYPFHLRDVFTLSIGHVSEGTTARCSVLVASFRDGRRTLDRMVNFVKADAFYSLVPIVLVAMPDRRLRTRANVHANFVIDLSTPARKFNSRARLGDRTTKWMVSVFGSPSVVERLCFFDANEERGRNGAKFRWRVWGSFVVFSSSSSSSSSSFFSASNGWHVTAPRFKRVIPLHCTPRAETLN